MKGRRIITLGRFAALFLVAGALACDGGTDPPDPEPNRAPVAVGSIPPLTLTEGESSTVDASLFFSDPDGDQLILARRLRRTLRCSPSRSRGAT